MAHQLARLGLRVSSVAKSVCLRKQTQMIPARACGWVQDFKPGPYPRTKEEREAAAAKYNLIPEDYEPYEEGSGYGDYPKLPPVGQDNRDPYEDFDYYYRRRNFGETLHIDYEAFMSDKSNPNVRTRYSYPVMIGTFLGFVSFIALLKCVDSYFDLHTANPMKPKQYSNSGRTNYTFESPSKIDH